MPRCRRRRRQAIATALRRARWKAERDRVHHLTLEQGPRHVAVLGAGPARDFDRRRFDGWLGKALQLGQEQRAGPARDRAAGPRRDAQRRGRLPHADAARALGLPLRRLQGRRQRTGRRARVQLLPPRGAAAVYREQRAAAAAAAEGAALARDLANTPPNEATPAWMAARARARSRPTPAEGDGLRRCAELRQLGMGGLLAVGARLGHAPRLVRLEWGRRGPRGRAGRQGRHLRHRRHLDQAGRGHGRDEVRQVRRLRRARRRARRRRELALPVRLRAYLPLAENMPTGAAYRPGRHRPLLQRQDGRDHQHRRRGADDPRRRARAGRPRSGPTHIARVLDPHRRLRGRARATGGRPLHARRRAGGASCSPRPTTPASGSGACRCGPSSCEEMKGTHADLKNSAGRWGGACTAAAFLSQFVGGHRALGPPRHRRPGLRRRRRHRRAAPPASACAASTGCAGCRRRRPRGADAA